MTHPPVTMDVAAFAERYPRLWHMAEAGSWPGIERHGLLSTTALLDLFEVAGEQRERLESRRRPVGEVLVHPVHGRAVVRDQHPIIEKVLARSLTGGMTPRDWYETLNRRVFLWVNPERLERMLGAPHYRDREHTVLTVDTAGLLAAHFDAVTLSPINSGTTFPRGATPRGPDTFRRIPDYPWAERLRRPEPVVELAVDYAVPDIARYVVDREDRRAR